MSENPTLVVGIGEVLYDCFPDRQVLGGAPLNSIVHLRRLLGDHGAAAIVSRVGDDPLGRQLAKEVADREIDARYLQQDLAHPTGKVQVTLSVAGQPSYEITEPAAWDFIDFAPPLKELAERAHAVTFGSLAQRHAKSRATIQKFLAAARQAIRLFDVNLRQNYFSAEVLSASFELATVGKINEEELPRVSQLLATCDGSAELDEQAEALRSNFDLDLVVLTRGKRGTKLFAAEGAVEQEPISYPANQSADSVGAGDACGAGLLYGLLNQLPPKRTLELANRMGAYVASVPGATPDLPGEILKLVGESRREA